MNNSGFRCSDSFSSSFDSSYPPETFSISSVVNSFFFRLRFFGRTIGKLAAEKLGIPCYDKELIEKIAEQSGYTADYVKEETESLNGGLFSTLFADRSMGMTNQDKIWTLQCRIITELAEKGSCILIGRCADYILEERENCLNVFIHASMEKRMERIVQQYGERDETPEHRVKEKDKQRMEYYKYYTGRKWGDVNNYQICLDSGELGIEKCADLICQLY